MIRVKSIRYHDRRLLLARYRLPAGQDVKVEILTGSYKGIYKVKSEVICSSPIEVMRTRNGQQISMRAIDIDRIDRIG